jgi:hypothetical protein
MSFSLDSLSIHTLKAEARELRTRRQSLGEVLSHGTALEAVAHAHGFRDWNTACAMLPERVASPLQVGQRVRGTYLGQAFTGLVLGVRIRSDMAHYEVTVKFDQPVDVVTSALFSAYRQRVVATVDINGVSPARLGNGQPQLRIERA